MDVLTTIKQKRAVRNYLDKPIPEADVHAILNAGRLSQSAKNLQPWHFIAIQDRQRLQQLAEQGNFSSHLGEAALGVVIVTPDPAERFQILFDAGQAAAYMQLAALALGIGSCPVTSYNREGVRRLLNIPDDWHVRVALAFGYQDTAVSPRKSSRNGRKSFDDIVHWETWGEDE